MAFFQSRRRRAARRRQRTFHSVSPVGMAVAVWALRPAGSRLAAGGLLLLWAILGGILLLHDVFYTRLDVAGARILSPEALAAASGIDGLHIFWVNPEEAAAAVRHRFPALRSATVRCRWPAFCTLFVVEGEASWEWVSGDLRLFLDENGQVMEGDAVNAQRRLEVYGLPPLAPGQRVDPWLWERMQDLSWAFPEIPTFRYEAGRGFSFVDPYGWPVLLGEFGSMATRAAAWRALRDLLAAHGQRPAYLDLRVPEAPTVGFQN
ncbi:FtsQ-type POTRA domain-containing protein [Thermoflexus sp.]|uniref:cell division protein FtsQ/DivIB n=2 Tax=Thermoflexus sp. TaxID=1969742 RepID=UPI0026395392|nr:FtsQ-type POTRA domain-containing protein [Thermoflexus sp.]MDW8184463.1 FtsQ-type POTRA domain-containing protein [Anaerolineae bacterium]